MKIAVIYYSFSGNTERLCLFMKKMFCERGYAVNLIRLKLKEEEASFMKQVRAARERNAPELLNTDYDLSAYEMVIFSSPVWAFTFTPALRTYLAKCVKLEGKKTAVILTCGSAITSGRALKELEEIALAKRGAVIFSAYITGQKTGNEQYLSERLKELMKL